MKILMLADTLNTGGAETHIKTLAISLKKLSQGVTVASSGGSVAKQIVKNGVPHRKLPDTNGKYASNFRQCNKSAPKIENLPFAFVQAVRTSRAISRIIESEKPDIVHAHTRRTAFLAKYICRMRKIPLIVTAHASFDMEFPKNILSQWGDGLVCVSEDVKTHLLHHSLSIKLPEDIEIIFNGVNLPTKTDINTQTSTNKSHKKRIVFASRLDYDCSDIAYSICRIAPKLYEKFGEEIEIIIVGGGSEYKQIHQKAYIVNQKLNHELINVVGEVESPSKFSNLNTLFLGVSRAALEFMAVGTPVLLCGNEGYLGLLTDKNLEKAQKTNFTCRG